MSYLYTRCVAKHSRGVVLGIHIISDFITQPQLTFWAAKLYEKSPEHDFFMKNNSIASHLTYLSMCLSTSQGQRESFHREQSEPQKK